MNKKAKIQELERRLREVAHRVEKLEWSSKISFDLTEPRTRHPAYVPEQITYDYADIRQVINLILDAMGLKIVENRPPRQPIKLVEKGANVEKSLFDELVAKLQNLSEEV